MVKAVSFIKNVSSFTSDETETVRLREFILSNTFIYEPI